MLAPAASVTCTVCVTVANHGIGALDRHIVGWRSAVDEKESITIVGN